MPIPKDICRVNLHWTFPGTPEIAVNTLHFHVKEASGAIGTLDWGKLGDFATRIASKVASNWSNFSIGNYHSANALLQRVEVYHLDEAGLTIDKAVAPIGANGEGVGGTTNTAQLPHDVALVLSLYSYPSGTFVRQASRRRGRIYLPGLAANSLGPSGQFSTTWLTNCVGAWSQLLKDLDGMDFADSNPVPGATNPTAELVILSKAAGEAYRVVRVHADSLPDTQRRRGQELVPAGVADASL